MADRLAAEIFIGGPVPMRLVPQLCSLIAAEGVALDWGDAPFQPQTAKELVAARRRHQGTPVLALCDDQARSGCFENLEAFLASQAIPFDRFHEAKYEFDAEWVSYRPGGAPRVVITDADRHPIVRAKVVTQVERRITAIVRALERSNTNRALGTARSLARFLAGALPPIIPLPEFTIREVP